VAAGLVPAGIFAIIRQMGDVTLRAAGPGDVGPLTMLCGVVVLLYGALWFFSYGQSVFLARSPSASACACAATCTRTCKA
jgi:hypothetical protein